jgi:ArsR family transcriptional regulator
VKENDIFRIQAQLLKALANEARLKIVHRLAEGECSCGQLTRVIGLDQSTVSKHLSLLKAHGIVRDRREGNVVYYELLTPAMQVLKERA